MWINIYHLKGFHQPKTQQPFLIIYRQFFKPLRISVSKSPNEASLLRVIRLFKLAISLRNRSLTSSILSPPLFHKYGCKHAMHIIA